MRSLTGACPHALVTVVKYGKSESPTVTVSSTAAADGGKFAAAAAAVFSLCVGCAAADDAAALQQLNQCKSH